MVSFISLIWWVHVVIITVKIGVFCVYLKSYIGWFSEGFFAQTKQLSSTTPWENGQSSWAVCSFLLSRKSFCQLVVKLHLRIIQIALLVRSKNWHTLYLFVQVLPSIKWWIVDFFSWAVSAEFGDFLFETACQGTEVSMASVMSELFASWFVVLKYRV